MSRLILAIVLILLLSFHLHAQDPPTADRETRIKQLESAIHWACGVNGDFERPDNARGSYWWRTELRQRAGISDDEIKALAMGADTLSD